MEFKAFEKLARLKRSLVITEKIDGTNAVVAIGENGEFYTGSRNRWITPEDDNFGFATWAAANKDELLKLGPGYHYGEWWGAGIQRGYGRKTKTLSLFNTKRWGPHNPSTPACCSLVPVLYEGSDFSMVEKTLDLLRTNGSMAAPGFMSPEGIVVYHSASRTMFKVTLDNDGTPKSLVGSADAVAA